MLDAPLQEVRLRARVEELRGAQHRVLVVEIWTHRRLLIKCSESVSFVYSRLRQNGTGSPIFTGGLGFVHLFACRFQKCLIFGCTVDENSDA